MRVGGGNPAPTVVVLTKPLSHFYAAFLETLCITPSLTLKLDCKRVIVGVNKFGGEEEPVEGGMTFDPTVEERQLASLAAIKKERDNQKVQATLDQIRRAAEGTENLMFPIIEAVKVQTTIGEICQELREVFGEYQPYTHL